jgi:hypothetical protein
MIGHHMRNSGAYDQRAKKFITPRLSGWLRVASRSHA